MDRKISTFTETGNPTGRGDLEKKTMGFFSDCQYWSPIDTQSCQNSFCSFVFCFLLFVLVLLCMATPAAYEIPRRGVKLELQLPTYAKATATGDPSHLCNLHHSSWQCWILNPQSKAKDRKPNPHGDWLGSLTAEPQQEPQELSKLIESSKFINSPERWGVRNRERIPMGFQQMRHRWIDLDPKQWVILITILRFLELMQGSIQILFNRSVPIQACPLVHSPVLPIRA